MLVCFRLSGGKREAACSPRDRGNGDADAHSLTHHASRITYLGEDRATRGDWLGRYGNECFVLCAMESPRDVVGGRLLPKRRWKESKTGFAATSPVWTDWKGEFFYEVETGDPKESVRHWIPIDELVTDDPRALRNPLEGRRQYASWDDHGETHPFDGKGPDLIATLEIPEGLHRLTLYFIDWDYHNTDRPRAQRVLIRDEKDELVCSSHVSAFGDGVYKVYGVAGPTKLKVRIQKDRGVAAALSGIFLDEIALPSAPEEIASGAKKGKESNVASALARYEELRRRSATDPAAFLQSAGDAEALVGLPSTLAKKDTAAAKWLQWQCANSLLVDPEGKEKAFSEYLAVTPVKDVAAASERVKELLRSGEIGLAKKAVAPWLELANKGNEETSRTALRDAVLLFCKRDPDFSTSLMGTLSPLGRGQGEGQCDFLLTLASELMDIAQQDARGPLHSKCVYRVAAGTYETIEKEMGLEALGDEGAFRRAEAIANSPGYYLADVRRGVAAYQEYLKHYPEGKSAQKAHLEIISLAGMLARNHEPYARRYADLAAASAQTMLAAASPRTGVGPAAAAAYQVGEIYTRAGDAVEARRWYEEVVKRVPTSPVGKRATDRISM